MSFAQSFVNWQADRAEFGAEICDDCGSEIYPDQDGCAACETGDVEVAA